MNILPLKYLIPVICWMMCFFSLVNRVEAQRKLPKRLNRLTISPGAELLIYKEHESDTGTNSDATVVNPTVRLEWSGQYGLIVGGLRASLPVAPTEDIEKWDAYGIKSYQTNVFKYEWKRADAYLGYFIAPKENRISSTVYLGVRSSFQKQTRDDFIQQGVRIPGKSVEKTKSYGLLLGLMGRNIAFTQSSPLPDRQAGSRWSWNYALEYVAPLSLKTTNSSYPGVEFKEKRGYTYEIKWGIEYKATQLWSFKSTLYGGRMHWEGSDWKTTPYGRLKWPKNDTDFLGINLSLTARF